MPKNTTAVARNPQIDIPFRRAVRNEKGDVVETFDFEPGVPQELYEDQLNALANDIGSALVITKKVLKSKQKVTEPDEFMIKPDWEATQKFAAEYAIKKMADADAKGIAAYLSQFQVKAYEKLEKSGFEVTLEQSEPDESPTETPVEDEPILEEVHPEPELDSLLLTSQAKLAEFFGVSEKMVKEWKGLGLEKPDAGYNTSDVYEWLESESLLGENVLGSFDSAMDANLYVFNRDGAYFIHAPSGECLNVEEETGNAILLSEGDVEGFIEGLVAE